MPCLSILEPSKTGGQRICLAPEPAAGDRREEGRGGSGFGFGFGLGTGTGKGTGSGFGFSGSSLRLLKEPAKSESSSIGKNSDEEEEDEGENEVQSPLKACFKVSMDSLEEALPMRRGISSFYNGKSRSFASLADASSSSSIKAIVKPESPYSRKRRNNLACNLLSENNHHHKNTKTPLFIRPHSGAISKKPTSFTSPSSPSNGRSTLALAVAMANTAATKTHPNVFNDQMTGLKPRGLGPSPLSRLNEGDDCASPLSLRGTCHWRSFSLVDLQSFGATVSSNLGAPDRIA